MNSQLNKLLERFKVVSLYGIGQSIGVVSQLIISWIIIKKHSAELWGAYVEVLLWVNLIVLFSYFGNKTYLLKIFSENPSQIDRTWVSNFLSRGILFLISALCILTISFFETYRWGILIWAFLLFYNQSFEVIILYQRDFKFSIITEFIRNLLIVGTLLLFFEQIQLTSFLYIIIGGNSVKAILYTLFYFKKLKYSNPYFDIDSLKKSFPFFIPMILGTIRTKVDAYYGTVFFSKTDLSKYQVLTNVMTLVQMGATYAINPYIKTFYRIQNHTRSRIEGQFSFIGIAIGVLVVPIMYGVVWGIYDFNFTPKSYLYAFLFIITLFIHLLLINDFYKKDRQLLVAIIIAITAIIQIVMGYFVIQKQQIEGALAIKAIGQWIMVVVLYIVKKRVLNKVA